LQYVYAKEVAARPRLARHAMCHAHATVAISRYTQDLALGLGVEPGRLHLIPPGVDQLAARAHSSTSDDPIILTICRLEDRYKGVDVLIRALTAIRSDVPRARLVVVGAGSLLPWLEGLALAEGVGEHVLFAGSVSDAERDSWLERAAVFAMPSRLPPEGVGGEGFGIVYLEAGLHELPVVAGNVGGAVDAVVHGETGLLVDPTSPLEVADAISDLMLDGERARRMGQAGAAHARDHAWSRIAPRVEKILLDVMARR
jgi:phosphatidylinositol alpha-1,6-mannosyltransferase